MDLQTLFTYDFFVQELLKWISIKDFGRLRKLNNQINKKITIDIAMDLISNPIVFRRATFRGRMDIIEKIIIFYDKKQQTQPIPFFPNPVLIKLIEQASSQGLLELLKKLFSMRKQLFPLFELEEIGKGLLEATKHKQFHVIRFYFDLFQTGKVKNASEMMEALMDFAYRKVGDKQLILFILEEQSKTNEQMAELLKRIRETSENPSNFEPFYLEWLYSLTSQSYRSICRIKTLFRDLIPSMQNWSFSIRLISDWEWHVSQLPLILPKQLCIDEFSKFKFSNSELTEWHEKRVCIFQQRWFLFTGDIQSFQNSVKTVEDIVQTWEEYNESDLLLSSCLLSFVVIRCIDTPQISTNELAFQHCLNVMKANLDQLNKSDLAADELASCFGSALYAKRTDMISKLFEVGNLIVQDSPAKRLMNKNLREFQLESPPRFFSSGDLDSIRFEIESGNEKVIEHFTQWFYACLSDACCGSDFEMVQYFLSLRSKFPTTITKKDIFLVHQEMKLRNGPIIIIQYLDDCLKGKINGWQD